MMKNNEIGLNITCGKCDYLFPKKVTVRKKLIENYQTEIDVNCPSCGVLLTVEVKGDIPFDTYALRKVKGTIKD